MATRSIEEIHKTTKQLEEAQHFAPRNWFQVYVWKDRGLLRDLLDRAKEANFEAIVITVDTAVLGRRERDVRRGFTLPPQLGMSTIVDGAQKSRMDLGFCSQ